MSSISRREFVQGALAIAAATQIGHVSKASATDQPVFSLPALPYDPAALEPVIDGQTMSIHHDKHHQGYVNKLNEEVAKDNQLVGKSLVTILAHISSYNEAVRNNAGGHFNHSFFWETMAPASQQGKPSEELKTMIQRDFGGMANLQKEFSNAAGSRFGSGWAWLLATKENKLLVCSTANQDNPLMDLAEIKGQPILGIDVWEHAYYLKYQNRRADYVSGWWSLINWHQANQRFASALKS